MDNLQQEIVLPNGTKIRNRIAKSAMSEGLGTKHQSPTQTLINVYEKWAQGGAGLLFTGNIMIDAKATGEPRNVVVEDKKDFELLKKWADTVKGTDIHIWPQLNHPGRQAMEALHNELVAPSAVPLKVKGRKDVTSKIPRALEESEIWGIIDAFGNAAAILQEAGFTGVQIHGAHGYLVSQFLSPYTNIREDKWGGGLENRVRFAIEIYRKIRERVGKDFPIGIKLNSADFQKGGFTEEESIEVVKILSAEGIDLIEISGGTYESPTMMGKQKASTAKREAYFMDYVEKARKVTNTPLMLTGGFRTPSVMREALASNKLDIIGIARPFAVYPNLANEIFNGSEKSFGTEIQKTGVKAIDGAMSIIWYASQIKRLGEGKTPDPKLSAWAVFFSFCGKIIEQKFVKRS